MKVQEIFDISLLKGFELFSSSNSTFTILPPPRFVSILLPSKRTFRSFFSLARVKILVPKRE